MDDVGTGGACAREMPVLHDLMRTEFTALHRLVGGVDPQDASRVTAVARHIRFMQDLLHFHHSTEDDLIWPPLKQRLVAAVISGAKTSTSSLLVKCR